MGLGEQRGVAEADVGEEHRTVGKRRASPPGVAVLVLGAVPWEIKTLRDDLQEVRAETHGGIPFWRGRLQSRAVALGVTGVGKTNAAAVTTLALGAYAPRALLFTGTAARLAEDLETGDVVLGRRTVHHDAGSLQANGMLYRKIIGPLPGKPTHYRFSADPALLAQAVRFGETYAATVRLQGVARPVRVRPGTICSGDLFGMTEAKLADIRQKLRADLVEMEGAAVSQVCAMLGVPHLVIRAGSNRAQEDPGADYRRLGQIAARSAARFTAEFLRSMEASAR